ncbi:MAG TPA: toll/interleukin-1 receptor domain-containing protein [Sedimentisphaerales bacterium]|nr:toll/interleukin-1 receptor domain-containing protein [Sedimentisphaerales bacterium]
MSGKTQGRQSMPHTTDFEFDVFLSHSSQDKPLVHDLAERLKADGLRVWFDQWQIRPGDSIPHKIEEGLERSRVLVLCMSANAFASDWATLESQTFRFRDPLNKDRRFIPLRLDEAHIKGSLAQFLYIAWLTGNRDQEYHKVLEACRPNGKPLTEIGDPRLQPPPNPAAQQTHDLRISISPTRNRLRQLAQIQLLNAGERPILIDSWFVEWNDKSSRESVCCEGGSLPVRLQDHERADLIVDICDHPMEELRSLGVTDAELRSWPATAKDLRRFIHVAKLHEPPKIDAQPDELGQPNEVSISVSASHANGELATRLEVTFKNLGPCDLELHSARVEWEYQPPREMPHEPGEPNVAEAGGSISLQYDKHRKILKPKQEAVFFLSLRDPFAQSIIAILAADVPDENLRVTVNASHWQWEAHSDEVPGAIREFARAVLREQYRAS